MANEANVKAILRKIKNNPATSAAARVLLEATVDKSTGFKREAIVETVALAGAASVNLTTQLPAGAKVIHAGYYLTTAMTLVTAVKLGIGTAAKPSGFLLSATTMTIGITQSLATAPATPADATVAAATTIALTTVDTNGALAGTGTGTVKVCVIYEYLEALTA